MADSDTLPTGKSSAAKAKPAAPRKASSQHPNTLDMLVEAITSLNDRKGASVPAIKGYILEQYKTVDPNMLKFRLRKALAKGLESGVISRPKTSEQTGPSLNGRFRIDKTKLAAQEKSAKAVAKPKTTTVKQAKPKPAKASMKTAAKPIKAKSPKTLTKASKVKQGTTKAATKSPPKKTKESKAKEIKPKTAAKSVDKKSTKDKPKKPKTKKLEKSPKKVIKGKK